jgi:MATE family multidrug resistance protein
MHQCLKDLLKDFKFITKKTMPMAASFTFSIELLATGVMAIHLNDDESYAAASILFQAYTSTIMQLAFSPVPSVGIHISPFFGELKRLELANAPIDEIDSMRIKLGNIFKAGLIESIVVSIPAGLALFFSDEIIQALHQSPEVAELASRFLKIFALSAPPLALRACIGQILYAKGDAKPAMYIGGVNFIIGTLLAIWFSKGGLGIQPQGLSGIAWGYNVESYLTAMGSVIYVSLSKKYSDIPLFSKVKSRELMQELSALMAVGGPLALTRFVEVSMTLALSIFAGLKGVTEQGTFSYSMQMNFLTFIFGMAFAQAVSYHVGRLMGSLEFDTACRAARNGLITTFIFVIPPCLFVNFYPQCLYNVLNIKGEQEELVPKLLPIILCGAVAQTGRYSVNQLLRVLRDNKGSTMTSILGMSTGVAAAAILGFETHAALYGIASGLLIGEGISLIGLLWRLAYRIKPEAISAIQADPESAEPNTWGSYFCSFFKCRAVTEEQEPLLPAPNSRNINS